MTMLTSCWQRRKAAEEVLKASWSVAGVPGLSSVVQLEAGWVRVDVLLQAGVGRGLHPPIRLDGERLSRREAGVGWAGEPGRLRVASRSGVEMFQETGWAGLAGLPSLHLVRREVFGHSALQLSHSNTALLGGGRAGGRQGGGWVGPGGGGGGGGGDGHGGGGGGDWTWGGLAVLLLSAQSSVGGLHRCLEWNKIENWRRQIVWGPLLLGNNAGWHVWNQQPSLSCQRNNWTHFERKISGQKVETGDGRHKYNENKLTATELTETKEAF